MIIKKEEIDLLYNCLNNMTNKEQEIFRLFYFEQYSIQQISNGLNLSYRTVINIKFNAIKKLKHMMKK